MWHINKIHFSQQSIWVCGRFCLGLNMFNLINIFQKWDPTISPNDSLSINYTMRFGTPNYAVDVIQFDNGAVATCLMMVNHLAACFAVLLLFSTTSNQRIRGARPDNQICQYNPETEPTLIHVFQGKPALPSKLLTVKVRKILLGYWQA